ncbi:lauroyl acyltransferase [Desulfuromonas versatilis]|uniref:Lauroyl acyltransferase n=1 Tax=Desulfuromonas versatilis TaxID=2802975 RepID=A0ABM8HS96_9BACT|nr:lysophospholipid acyltransferase family protein [Desulfuromonas versatilis]BCR04773.1 lauroyl acyltransferase [Desulfuromonas versatilis]
MVPQRFFRNLLEYGLFMGLATLSRALPRDTAMRFGSRLGVASRHLQKKRAQTATDNLQRALPELSSREIEEMVARTFAHLGCSAVEMLRLDMFRDKADLEKYFSISGLEHLRAAYDLNRGVFLLSGHLGFWEVGTFFLPLLGFPVDFVAKRMKNPYVDRYFSRLREAGGGSLIESRRGARKIVRALAANRGVAVLLDQHIKPSEGVEVNFFNRPAYTTPIIAQIALKHGIPVVPMFAYRTPDFHYRVEIQPMLRLGSEVSPKAVQACSQRFTDQIEQAVRREPCQWFWVHRRWRDRSGSAQR